MAATSQPRQARSRATMERILAAAYDLLAEGGYKAVTHRAVADRAKVSLSATTRYFNSKQDLLVETFGWGVRRARLRYREFAEMLIAEDPGNLADYCQTIVTQDLSTHASAQAAWYKFVIESSRNAALRPATQLSFEEMEAFWSTLTRRAGVVAERATDGLLDFLIGEYLLALSTPNLDAGRVAASARRAAAVAEAVKELPAE